MKGEEARLWPSRDLLFNMSIVSVSSVWTPTLKKPLIWKTMSFENQLNILTVTTTKLQNILNSCFILCLEDAHHYFFCAFNWTAEENREGLTGNVGLFIVWLDRGQTRHLLLYTYAHAECAFWQPSGRPSILFYPQRAFLLLNYHSVDTSKAEASVIILPNNVYIHKMVAFTVTWFIWTKWHSDP